MPSVYLASDCMFSEYPSIGLWELNSHNNNNTKIRFKAPKKLSLSSQKTLPQAASLIDSVEDVKQDLEFI